MGQFNVIPKEIVPTYRRTMRFCNRFAERTAPELFRWLGWSTALAAVQVVAIRTESSWLKAVPILLGLFVAARIQWFIGLKHPEVPQQDGSLLIRFQWWRMLIAPVGWLLTWVFAVGAANLIAQSDLLPPIGETKAAETTKPRITPEAQSKVAPVVAPAAASSVTRSVPLAPPAAASTTVPKPPNDSPKVAPQSAVTH
ncbi:hypothetical protein [Noviluteimonas gilva]|uniref:Transmembrane protein n=1 Tax=Noviluteimonas gilva TaxID=2682097 RepID=A0A7C9HTU2_9GAMM|nr:hypothetical protein [Lysobacter gilvus]MUV14691.1 hypothetical protein [Lysobacter gilvus]